MVVKSRYTRQLKFITSHLPNWIQPLHEFVATFIAVKLGFGWEYSKMYATIFLLMGFLIVLGLLINFISWLFDNTSSRSKPKNNRVVLYGPMSSGKTCLFYRMVGDKYPRTVTNMERNEIKMSMSMNNGNITRTIHLIDVPGHPSMKSDVLSLMPGCICGIFVIDGTKPMVQECCEYLYDLFVYEPFVNNPAPLIILVNKQDCEGCKSYHDIITSLETELDKIKESRGSIEEVGKTQSIKLGIEGQKFTFDMDAPCPVYFKDISAKKDEDIKDLKEFILSTFKTF